MKTMNDMINSESCTPVGSVLPEQTDRFAPTGWVCPTCKRVYSPFTFMCPYCGGDKGRDFVTVATTSEYVTNVTTDTTSQMVCS
jgi:rubredoxin